MMFEQGIRFEKLVPIPSQHESSHHHEDKADLYTNGGMLVKGTLAFIATAFWIASLIDDLARTSGSALGFSWPAAIIGFVLSAGLTFCDSYCHRIQDGLSQYPANTPVPVVNPNIKLTNKAQFFLYGSALADAVAIAGLFTSVISEISVRVIGHPMSDLVKIILLVSTFVCGLFACVSEYRTHKRALQEAETKKSVEFSQSEIELQLENQQSLSPNITVVSKHSIQAVQTAPLLPTPARARTFCPSRVESLPSASGLYKVSSKQNQTQTQTQDQTQDQTDLGGSLVINFS